MSDNVDDLLLTYNDDQDAAVLVGEDEIADLAELLSRAPALTSGDHPAKLAEIINHLAHASQFQVITDPAEFAAWYRETLAAETPAEEWDENAFSLSKFAEPALDRIAAPAQSGDALVFFVVNTVLGTPYRVTVPLDGDGAFKADYAPLEGPNDPETPPDEDEEDDIE